MGHYGDLKVRTDQESAIADLFRAVAKERGSARMVLTHAARSDSKGNGQAEKAVQSIEEMVRTLFIDLEQRCCEELSVHDSLLPWLVEHACDLLNRFKVRKGNKTAWEYLTGEPYTGEVYPFGTPVQHRMSGPVQGGVISERWFDGYWLGLQFSSGEHIVATADGRVIRARAVHPRPETVQVTREALNQIAVGPWNPSEVITQDSGDKPPTAPEKTQVSKRAEPVPRSIRITREKLEKFGYTKGCPQCEAMRRGDDHDGVHHSTATCRKRIEIEMSKDEAYAKDLADAENRKRGFLARRVEASDKERVDAEKTSSGPVNLTEDAVCTWIECARDKKHGPNSLKNSLLFLRRGATRLRPEP